MSARRINAALIPKASEALDRLVKLSGFSATEVLNRALQAYAFIEEEAALGRQFCLYDPESKSFDRVRFL